ncbi:hypothetical protein ES703_85504 [subsurface metagenome]
MNSIETKEEISDIDSFIKAVKEIGGLAIIFSRDKIEKNYGGRLRKALNDLFDIVCDLRFKQLSVTFEEKKQDMTWYSANSGRIVANLTFNPGTPAFKKNLQQKAEEARTIEEDIQS